MGCVGHAVACRKAKFWEQNMGVFRDYCMSALFQRETRRLFRIFHTKSLNSSLDLALHGYINELEHKQSLATLSAGHFMCFCIISSLRSVFPSLVIIVIEEELR